MSKAPTCPKNCITQSITRGIYPFLTKTPFHVFFSLMFTAKAVTGEVAEMISKKDQDGDNYKEKQLLLWGF